ncbi:MAG TPA: hypothetical protein VGC89_00530, partial [Pyrinomonadaceae bacterium]
MPEARSLFERRLAAQLKTYRATGCYPNASAQQLELAIRAYLCAKRNLIQHEVSNLVLFASLNNLPQALHKASEASLKLIQ